MKLFVTAALSLLLQASVAQAIGPGLLDNLVAFSGQGVPRATEEDCSKAGEALLKRLAAFSFEQLAFACVGTSQDIGGYIPVIKGRAPKPYSTEQAIGARFPATSDCRTALAALIGPIDPRAALESECLQGREEATATQPAHAFFQPWVTKLVAQDGRIPQSARRKSRAAAHAPNIRN